MAEADIANFGEDTPPERKSGLLFTLAAVTVLSLLGIGGGWMLGTVLAPSVENRQEPVEQAQMVGYSSKDKRGEDDEPLRPNLFGLEPLTTNLSYPADNWVRIEAALLFRDAPDQRIADEISEDILAYLRTVSLQQIDGPRGFHYLREDIAERARLRSEGQVTDVIIRTFVIE
ncbi:flagellar basal body-associated FliL family protein [Pseudohoeflea coraliihabitans]|uniref:Flagellar protein FliL n=1 Tax=Pseudohoeflea coraliihabitans TaxID=2860393 RepID=A0ABS6WN26_9HYPH|nr:flagellar basal body-associated FliL family protein [Pseudohoeflea sp. DP4N28-3]MBW3097366.1 flagellar basal body-associated FliL family protein [Pseudohoeflea sp. DP4N28-3]